MSKSKEFYTKKDYGTCFSKKNDKGTWVSICNCKHGSFLYE